MKHLVWIAVLMVVSTDVIAQANRIDIVRHDAPELASYGSHSIGVQTLDLVDPGRPDILNTSSGGDTAVYDRKLTVEVWYPAQLSSTQSAGGEYRAVTRNPAIIARLQGAGVRDATADNHAGPYPLVVISHGYPGNRFLMSHLGENLASKGYVAVSIDHTDSTYDDQQPFTSTLYNRPLDQRFVIQQIAELSEDSGSFLNGLVDADTVAVVGYSMGGYGLVNNLGGGYSDDIVTQPMAPPNELLHRHATGNPEYRSNLDGRIRAGVAIAPWGMNAGFWRSEDLHGVTVPTLYVAGDVDTVAGYENGTRAIYENTINSDRYLLTYKNAGHNAGAPIPLPVEIQNSTDQTGASHYTDPVWDNIRMNNIMDHFVTAFLDLQLKGIKEQEKYLDLVADSADAVYSNDAAQHTYWHGFARGTAQGLMLEHRAVGQ